MLWPASFLDAVIRYSDISPSMDLVSSHLYHLVLPFCLHDDVTHMTWDVCRWILPVVLSLFYMDDSPLSMRLGLSDYYHVGFLHLLLVYT